MFRRPPKPEVPNEDREVSEEVRDYYTGTGAVVRLGAVVGGLRKSAFVRIAAHPIAVNRIAAHRIASPKCGLRWMSRFPWRKLPFWPSCKR